MQTTFSSQDKWPILTVYRLNSEKIVANFSPEDRHDMEQLPKEKRAKLLIERVIQVYNTKNLSGKKTPLHSIPSHLKKIAGSPKTTSDFRFMRIGKRREKYIMWSINSLIRWVPLSKNFRLHPIESFFLQDL